MTAAAGGDGWAPRFAGQRPPFPPGNEANLVHGARSERHVGPLADRIAAELLADPDTPDHLREPVFGSALMSYARALAVCELLTEFLNGQNIVAAMASLATTEEEETQAGGKVTRRGKTRSVASALDTLRRWESHAANLRAQLGLSPASAARVGRDLAVTRRMSAPPLAAALDEIAQRRALAGGGAGG